MNAAVGVRRVRPDYNVQQKRCALRVEAVAMISRLLRVLQWSCPRRGPGHQGHQRCVSLVGGLDTSCKQVSLQCGADV